MATRAAITDNRAVQIDRVLSRAFTTIRGNVMVIFGLCFLFAGAPSMVIAVFSQSLRPQTMNGDNAAGYFAAVFGFGILAILFYILAQGALVRATLAHAEGRRASFGECALTGLRATLPLIGLNLLLGIAIGVASLFFLVPGVILYQIWAVANAALVAERIGVFASFSRSAALTRGARWKVFGIELIAIAFVWILSSVLSIVVIGSSGLAGFMAMSRDGQPLWYMLLTALIQTAVVAIWGTIQTSLYIELRDWKDGPAGAALAEVFA